jgi:hypothetical protein
LLSCWGPIGLYDLPYYISRQPFCVRVNYELFHFAFIEEGPVFNQYSRSDMAGTVHFNLFSPAQCSIVNDQSTSSRRLLTH